MKIKNFMDLHQYLLSINYVGFGICTVFEDDFPQEMWDIFFKVICPTEKEIEEHKKDGYYKGSWGSKLDKFDSSYNEFRQTVVLLCAAFNNEL